MRPRYYPRPRIDLVPGHRDRAQLIRHVSGTTDLEKTLAKATRVLSEHNIPSLVVGGFAVQEHGYARFTADVDLVVPDVQAAREWLSIGEFKEVNLLPGGGSVGPGPLKLPTPSVVSATPRIADLETLLEIKLSSYMGSPGSRLKDAADVVELIKANDLPREYPVASPVRATYQKLWDDLHPHHFS